MATSKGHFVWYDLMADDAATVLPFYRAVLGWSADPSPLEGSPYWILNAGPMQVGGMMDLPQAARDKGARPGWIGYIGVEDVEATVEAIKAAGGGVHRAPEDIPTVGRFAVVHDPQGATFTVFAALDGREAPVPPPFAPGHIGWHELYAEDWQKAFDFYASLFGWTKREAIDMGPMGTYQLFATGGETAVGGMMNKPSPVPRPVWGYYFNVDDTSAAIERIKAHGGEILNGPMQVPGGSWIAQCLDPQGAYFSVVGPESLLPR